MDDLAKLQGQWVRLLEKGKFREAEKFGYEKLFPIVLEKFVKENTLKEQYDWLIIPAGTIAEYAILLIKAVHPTNVYFIGTNEFKDGFLDIIVEKSGLLPSQYICDVVPYKDLDTAKAYEKIRNRLNLFENKKVMMDLTRGKRILTAGAGMIAAFFGFDLVYVHDEWLQDLKRGLPGTEKLVKVKNPFDVFGDLQIRESHKLFNNHNYRAALFVYDQLKEKISDVRPIEVETLIAQSYYHWSTFNFKAAHSKLIQAESKSLQYEVNIPDIKENISALDILSSKDASKSEILKDKEFAIHLMVDLYANAIRRSELHMFEDSVSRLYRLFELVSQHRLATLEIPTIGADLGKLEKKYKKLTKELFGIEKSIPHEIGLKAGYVILFLLEDELMKDEDIGILKKLFEVVRVRDTSIIAHGMTLVGKSTFVKMEKLACQFLNKICGKEYDLNELIKQHTFVKL